jgi:hypothetical protein
MLRAELREPGLELDRGDATFLVGSDDAAVKRSDGEQSGLARRDDRRWLRR